MQNFKETSKKIADQIILLIAHHDLYISIMLGTTCCINNQKKKCNCANLVFIYQSQVILRKSLRRT